MTRVSKAAERIAHWMSHFEETDEDPAPIVRESGTPHRAVATLCWLTAFGSIAKAIRRAALGVPVDVPVEAPVDVPVDALVDDPVKNNGLRATQLVHEFLGQHCQNCGGYGKKVSWALGAGLKDGGFRCEHCETYLKQCKKYRNDIDYFEEQRMHLNYGTYPMDAKYHPHQIPGLLKRSREVAAEWEEMYVIAQRARTDYKVQFKLLDSKFVV